MSRLASPSFSISDIPSIPTSDELKKYVNENIEEISFDDIPSEKSYGSSHSSYFKKSPVRKSPSPKHKSKSPSPKPKRKTKKTKSKRKSVKRKSKKTKTQRK